MLDEPQEQRQHILDEAALLGIELLSPAGGRTHENHATYKSTASAFGAGSSSSGCPTELNVIYGPNEAGKTTLMQFVRAVFFGFSSRRGARAICRRCTTAGPAAL